MNQETARMINDFSRQTGIIEGKVKEIKGDFNELKKSIEEIKENIDKLFLILREKEDKSENF